MRLTPVLLGSVLALAWSEPAGAIVSVTFEHPERYADAGAYGADRERVLRELRQHLEALGDRDLAPGQTLRLTVLDIDLAGRQESWRRNAYDLRVMTGATWPRIRLRYALEANGDALAVGEESVIDQSYLQHVASPLDGDPLRYEKSMLEDWFRRRFRS